MHMTESNNVRPWTSRVCLVLLQFSWLSRGTQGFQSSSSLLRPFRPLRPRTAPNQSTTCTTTRTCLAVVFDKRDISPAPLGESQSPLEDNGEPTEATPNESDASPSVPTSPESQKLIARLTENYVFGHNYNNNLDTTVDDILNVIERDFFVRQVPVQIGDTLFDASTTGIAMDQSITEILSFAAYHELPHRLTADLLDDTLGDPFATAKTVFSKQGWKAVSFPKGLAIQPRATAERRRRWRWARKERVSEAMRAVRAAAAARSPIRQLQTPKDFLTKLMAEEKAAQEQNSDRTPKNLPFFPNTLPVPTLSWQRLRRAMEQCSSKIKQKGKAGVLAYAIINFVLYSAGMLWHWQRLAPVTAVTGTSHAWTLVARKLGRVFGTVYIISNVLKIPKLFMVAGLLPLTDQCLQAGRRRTQWSHRRLLVTYCLLLVATWAGLLVGPVLSEFLRLRQLVYLESLWDQYAVIAEPAAAIVASCVPAVV